jgi:precorrin-6Y C5,15-methyltransferase (decarboxylating)
MTSWVTVLGTAASQNVPPGGWGEALRDARLVVGAAWQLAAVPLPVGCEQIVLGPLEPAMQRIERAVAAGADVVVLASGDPGFFGIVRRLHAAGLPLRVRPEVSSVASAFARAGLPWDGAVVVSAHGRDLRPAVNACRALPMVAVLTGPGAGASEIGAALSGWPRHLVVAEHLGMDTEHLTRVSAEEAAHRTWADPHVVLVLADPGAPSPPRRDNQPAAAPSGGWALPETAYAHRDSMITKSEVRALAVARLRPGLGRQVWDLGAGSGSVGIECALLSAAVVAVDDDPLACDLVRANATRHGVDVRVVQGRAPRALDELAAPDSVFVGGGGLDVVAAVAGRPPASGPDTIVVALAAIDRVAPAVELLRGNGFRVEGVQLSAARLTDLPAGALRLAAANPVVLLTGERAPDPQHETVLTGPAA